MTEQSQVEAKGAPVELRRLDILAKKYETDLGPLKIIPVGNAGYIVERLGRLPMAGNDWAMLDYDDTSVATTEIKQKRKEMYVNYVKNILHLTVEENVLDQILQSTDEFSRWEDKEGAGKSYHANIHMSSLTWFTKELQKSSQETDFNSAEFVKIKRMQLDRIKRQRDADKPDVMDNDPFYFRSSDKKIVLKSKLPWLKEIQNIFTKTMINPPPYNETIDAAKEIASPKDSIHRMNVGMLSYGDPYYQFLKICELLKANPEFPVSQIWLTAVPKGEFIKEAISTGATRKLHMDYVPSYLEDTEGESMAFGSGYPLGQHRHVIVLFDDSIKEAESVLSVNPYLKEHSGAQFIVVRSLRSGTKEEKKVLNIQSPYGTVDFRSVSLLPGDIAGILKVNRYLARKKNFPRNDLLLTRMKEELIKKYGFEENTL